MSIKNPAAAARERSEKVVDRESEPDGLCDERKRAKVICGRSISRGASEEAPLWRADRWCLASCCAGSTCYGLSKLRGQSH